MSTAKANVILKCRNELIDIHRCAIDAIKPEKLIKNSIQVTSDGCLLVRTGQTPSQRYKLTHETRIHVVGGGKSVMAMASGLADVAQRYGIQEKFSHHGRLSIPLGLESDSREKTLASIGIKCLYGSKNNLPDDASVEASKSILDSISSACLEDIAHNRQSLFIVLISGGGSACLTSPRHISLAKKLEVIKVLVQKGANIVELNKVRTFFSNLKGGQLARYILSRASPSSRVLTLILSDVIGNPIEFIASGPTCLQGGSSQSTARHQKQQALQVLSHYGYPLDLGPFPSTEDHGVESLHDNNRLLNHIIGSNQVALDAAMQKARELGYEVLSLGSEFQGNTSDIMQKIVGSAVERFQNPDFPQRLLAIGGGEATVAKADHETWGEGGRAQEMALDYLISRLREPGTRQDAVDMFLAGTTDGQDGPTDVGACLASRNELIHDDDRASIKLEDALKAKASHDSYNFWRTYKPDWLIKTGLTGTNVMDLYMYSLARFPENETLGRSKL